MLTDAAIKRKGPKAKPYKVGDARGLYLLVTPAGGKLWRFDYRFGGKRRTMSLGAYDDVTLEAARDKLHEARKILASGRDPMVARKDAQRAVRAAQSFETVAKEWLALQQASMSPQTYRKATWMFQAFMFPAFGGRAIGSLEPPDVLEMLRAVEKRGLHDTAHRVRQYCGLVLRYAIATGRATRDATADLKGALAPVVTKSHAAITDPVKVGALLRAIQHNDADPSISAALRLAPYVFVRPGELRTMEWAHVDLAAKLWKIPSERMKMREAHLVPLSRQAIEILEEIKPLTGEGRYVFPAVRSQKRPMSDGTLSAVLRRLGYSRQQMTVHGFRAMARTLLDERLRWQPDVIEVQLAHVVPGALGATYNRARYLEQRTEMMQAYADYLDALRDGN